jgi:hypothetical protein
MKPVCESSRKRDSDRVEADHCVQAQAVALAILRDEHQARPHVARQGSFAA